MGNSLLVSLSLKPMETGTHAAWGPGSLLPGPTLSGDLKQAQEMAGMKNLTMGAWPWGHFITGGTVILGQLMTSH